MTQLLVRDLPPELVLALKRRATKHGRSAEAEHREILRLALVEPQKTTFAQALAAMPNVGEDKDFERRQETKGGRVFT